MSLRIELINTDNAFELLKDDWNGLLSECKHCKIFSSWEWMHTWWQVYKQNNSQVLYILCAYDESDENKLVGIAPFYIVKKYPLSFISGKVLHFIGNGEQNNDKVISQYNDFIVQPELEAPVCESILVYLQDNKKDWDFANFPFLLKDTLVHECFINDSSNYHYLNDHYGFRSIIPKTENFDSYLETLPKRWAKTYKKKNHLLERDGEVTITTTDTTESVDDALKLLAHMHEERWKKAHWQDSEHCIFDSVRFYKFHQELLKKLAPLNKAYIKTLYLDGKPLASYYAFSDKGEVHYYQSGFYSEHANRYSPLFLLVCKEIGLTNTNNKLFDFMFTDTDQSYKQVQYAAESEKMYQLMVTRNKSRLRFFLTLRAMKHGYLKFCESMKKQMSHTKQ